MSYVKIRPRRGTAGQWTSANPVLAEGEIGYEVPDAGVGTGVSRIKIGDGSTAWSELPYADPIDYIDDVLKVKTITTSSVAKLKKSGNQMLLHLGGIATASAGYVDYTVRSPYLPDDFIREPGIDITNKQVVILVLNPDTGQILVRTTTNTPVTSSEIFGTLSWFAEK